MDLSTALHQCRTAHLRNIDANAKTVVSIGAADVWYFNWISECCGNPGRHIGVEYYMPKPNNLPSNVEWVSNTAGSMPDVETGVADILISGQNIEHLWRDEIMGFLAEAHRIVRVDGMMVLDSPNRLVTQAYGGAHPEHMVELTPTEAADLVTAAGFDVVSVQGIFLCRDVKTGAILSIEDLSGPISLVERCVLGGQQPDHSYIWWLTARRADRAPDPVRIEQIIDRYWSAGWPERLDRLVSNTGVVGRDETGAVTWDDAVGTGGALVYGPYAPLKAGDYSVQIDLRRLGQVDPEAEIAHVDVVFEDGSVALAHTTLLARDIEDEWTTCQLDFALDRMRFGFQIRVFSTGAVGLSVKKKVQLDPPYV